MSPQVDLVVLMRDAAPLHPDVDRGIHDQRAVQLVVHRVAGAARSDDRSRLDAIVRARNEGKLRGTSPWLMFLDDDVVLEPACISTLVYELSRRPTFAALAADYLGERSACRIAPHVSMGATLFRRRALEQVHFRWDEKRCECQCCCDDLRRQHLGIDYCCSAVARHLRRAETGASTTAVQGFDEGALVSCTCVTRGRVQMLRRSIQCFLNQTYHHRELVVVYQSDDDATRQFLGELGGTSIHPVEVPAVPRLPLGSLRNIALRACTGKYVAQWDDDDWYSPSRLAEQMAAIRESGKRGCLLSRCTLYDCVTRRAYVSNARPWENSIVVERALLPLHPDVARREDTPVVVELIRWGQLTLLDRPELYIYTYHGMNTWDRYHWERILNLSQPLSEEMSGRVSALLGIDRHGTAGVQAFTSNAILSAIAALSKKTPVTESTKKALLSTRACETRASIREPRLANPDRRTVRRQVREWNK